MESHSRTVVAFVNVFVTFASVFLDTQAVVCIIGVAPWGFSLCHSFFQCECELEGLSQCIHLFHIEKAQNATEDFNHYRLVSLQFSSYYVMHNHGTEALLSASGDLWPCSAFHWLTPFLNLANMPMFS
jgi:hypothetical protein